MPTPALSDEILQQAIDALSASSGVKDRAAASINVNPKTFRHRLKLAALRGMLGTKPVLPGFEISKTTAVTDAEGNVVREFIQENALSVANLDV